MTDIASEDPDDIAEVGRMLLRDVARIRGTRPPALAAAENFIMGWLSARPERDGMAYFDLAPDEFIDAFVAWQDSLPAAQRFENQPPHELDEPAHMLFWDLDLWLGLVCMPGRRLPPSHLDEAVLVDIFACYREIDSETRDALWKQRYPEADAAQWDKWLNNIHAFFHPPADR
jgi:hypothetical protein